MAVAPYTLFPQFETSTCRQLRLPMSTIPRSRLLLLPVAVLLAGTGCSLLDDALGADGWTASESQGGIAGRTVTATKDFTTEGGPAFVRMAVS